MKERGLYIPIIDKFIVDWVTWLSLHDVTFSFFIGEGNSGYLC